MYISSNSFGDPTARVVNVVPASPGEQKTTGGGTYTPPRKATPRAASPQLRASEAQLELEQAINVQPTTPTSEGTPTRIAVEETPRVTQTSNNNALLIAGAIVSIFLINWLMTKGE